ncbi:MAG: hypothetical protein ABFD08_19965 [Syntrophomonas sp.]
MGFIKACETARLLTGQGTLLTDTLLIFDALDLSFGVLQNGENELISLYGINPAVIKLKNYQLECES